MPSPQESYRSYKTVTKLKDNSEVLIRSIKQEDAKWLLIMFTTLSPETVYNRFFKLRRPFTSEEVAKMVSLNTEEEFALIGSPIAASDLNIISDARYYVEEKTKAEVSIVVHDKWRLKGLGTAMLRNLIEIGGKNGIKDFYIYVLSDNAVMIHVAKKLDFKLTSQSYGISRLDLIMK